MNLNDLNAARMIMITYLKLKLEEEDWHGVCDAGMDLREIDAKISVSKGNVENIKVQFYAPSNSTVNKKEKK